MRQVGYKPSAKVADTGRMWTKSIWDRIPWTAIQAGERDGWVFFDDFVNAPAYAALDEDSNLYATYSDTGSTIQQGAANEYGELVMTLDTTDNDEAWIQTGGNTGGLAKFIKQATAVPHMIAFECRWKKSSITTGGTYIGFGEEGLAAADTIADAGTIADKDFFGFFTPEADADGVDLYYAKAGQTGQTKIADADTVVANTYMKHGFIYDYRNSHAKQIEVYIDGVINATYVTKANIDAATFPAGEEMALLAGVKNSTAAANVLTIDWWRAALVPLG